MTEEGKLEETPQMEVSHFSTDVKRRKESRRSVKEKEEIVTETMQILIEKKTNKKSIVNLYLNENSNSQLNGNTDESLKQKSGSEVSKKFMNNLKKTLTDSSAIHIEDIMKRERHDFYGNLIKRGPGKKQKITFVDNIKKRNSVPENFQNREFINIIDVESYKTYNIDISQNLGHMERTTNCCGSSCLIY